MSHFHFVPRFQCKVSSLNSRGHFDACSPCKMSKERAPWLVLNGKAHMFWDSGNAVVVLLKRPRAAALSREAKRRVGIQNKFYADARRNVRTCPVGEEGPDVQRRPATPGANGREASFRNSPRVGRKGGTA